MKTANLSRSQVQSIKYTSNKPIWLISINDPNDTPPKFETNFDTILCLHFHDISKLIDGYVRINKTHIEAMVNFITLAKTSNVDLYVHCAAGICRSGAVVEVLKLAGWEINETISNERKPNMFVYDSLRKALNFKHGWEL